MTKLYCVLGLIGVMTSIPAPASAATSADMARVRLLSRLPAGTSPDLVRSVDALLALPGGVTLSPEFVDAAVVGWRNLPGRVRVPAVKARVASLAASVRPADPLPAAVPFDVTRYREHVTALSSRFNRLMGHPDNDLGAVCDFLEAHYRRLGLRVERQSFRFRGRVYQNLVATLPGRSRERILLVDHFDVAPTADYEPVALDQAPGYGLTRTRIDEIKATHRTGFAVPGADDNASATAALMESAQALVAAKVRPTRTIQFLHLNGEEFPGDSFGAKQFVARALARREPIAGVVVMDMIGVNRQKDRVFQIAPGLGGGSAALADRAVRAATREAKGYKPAVRLFPDHRSYLYNTDGQVFSAAGYPVVLLNEHLNYHEDLDRLGYHDEFDRIEFMDWDYAAAIAKTGLTAALAASGLPRARRPAPTTPAERAAHFQIEVRYSPLYEAVLAAEKARGRDLRTSELASLIRKDLATGGDPSQHDSSVAKRLTTWFRPPGWKPMDFGAIIGELRYQRLRDKAYRGAAY